MLHHHLKIDASMFDILKRSRKELCYAIEGRRVFCYMFSRWNYRNFVLRDTKMWWLLWIRIQRYSLVLKIIREHPFFQAKTMCIPMNF